MKTIGTTLLLAATVSFSSHSADWNQFRGSQHDGTSTEIILKKWPAAGPRLVWRVPLNSGFSSFVVGSGKAFTLVSRDVDGATQEVCVALDKQTGKEIWSAVLGIAKYDKGGNAGARGNDGGDGPRSTPAVADGKVYTMSGRLVLECFDAEKGKKIWAHDLAREFGGQQIHWEDAASPVVDEGRVFVAGGGPGQALLAFDAKDGHIVWKGQDDNYTHSTPTITTMLGERQIIFFTQTGLASLQTKSGRLLWRFPFTFRTSTAMTPVAYKDMVYCSAAYGVGSAVCKVTKTGDTFQAKELWFQPANVLNNHWSTPVCKDGYLYGLFGQKEFVNGPMKCVEIATGKVVWSQDGFGPGGCALVDGNVLALGDAGDLTLAKASPAGFSSIAKFHALAGKCWSSPSISDGQIFVRSTTEGACFDVSP